MDRVPSPTRRYRIAASFSTISALLVAGTAQADDITLKCHIEKTIHRYEDGKTKYIDKYVPFDFEIGGSRVMQDGETVDATNIVVGFDMISWKEKMKIADGRFILKDTKIDRHTGVFKTMDRMVDGDGPGAFERTSDESSGSCEKTEAPPRKID
jgi:hypothetical protein